MEALITAITGAFSMEAIVTGAGVLFAGLAIAYTAFKGGSMLIGVLKRG